MDTIGNRLITVRKQLALSQEELAKILCVNRLTLSRYEHNDRTPSADILSILVTRFNINANWILAGKGPIFQDRRLVNEMQNLKESNKELVCQNSVLKDSLIENLNYIKSLQHKIISIYTKK